ncbi:hypothetical protein SASPL_106546 [Salvia splendens]|uniref:Uncharacterized protein n=1 Tax=Salvia splendens TaxID=180675 RepID=A0A8X8YQV3_SALSN|nr:hypothetical protein SASPL_106546 [Salvia splendens]
MKNHASPLKIEFTTRRSTYEMKIETTTSEMKMTFTHFYDFVKSSHLTSIFTTFKKKAKLFFTRSSLAAEAQRSHLKLNCSSSKKAAAINSNCEFPADNSPCITRLLAEILRDPVFKINDDRSTFIPWSGYGRVTVRGVDGEVRSFPLRATVSSGDGDIADPAAAAEEIAFCRASSRFGLGLYLYHQD